MVPRLLRRAWPLALVAACAAPALPTPFSAPAPSASAAVIDAPARPVASAPSTPLADALRSDATRLLESARASRRAHARLRELTDGIGHRLSGSAALERAVDWAEASFRADGHEQVRRQPVKVPHWVRGEERLTLRSPTPQPLVVLGLGGTVGTPARGLRGEVVAVTSFAELTALGETAKGKIVLFNHPMRAPDEHSPHYGEAVVYRSLGAVAGAKAGAIAVLVRSVTAHSLRTPHTGGMRYEEGVPRIPAAAVTVEDAELLARLAAEGQRPEVELFLGARELPDALSHNVLGEITGREAPDEVVLIGAHLDSWDVGQGAHDDGAGCVMVLEALREIRALGLRPRRTLRGVLFTNEENGLRGGKAYAAEQGERVARHVAALEADLGAYEPRGFFYQLTAERRAPAPDVAAPPPPPVLADLVTLLSPLGATALIAGHSGADVTPLVERGVLGLGLAMDHQTYFDLHHTPADTLDKVDPEVLARDVAAMAVFAWALAETTAELPRSEPSRPPP